MGQVLHGGATVVSMTGGWSAGSCTCFGRVPAGVTVLPLTAPYTTVYNRFNRWSRQGIWFAMFEALTGSTGITAKVSIDSTHIKAHRSAGGAKGGPSPRPSATRGAGAPPRSMPSRTPKAGRA